MTEYYADGRKVMMRGKMADFDIGAMSTPQLAAQTALCLTLLSDASDNELASLVEAGAGADLVKAYRKAHEQIARDAAEIAGADAAYSRGRDGHRS